MHYITYMVCPHCSTPGKFNYKWHNSMALGRATWLEARRESGCAITNIYNCCCISHSSIKNHISGIIT